MLSRLFLILVVVSSFTICKAQDLVDVFSRYYPEQVLKYPNFKKGENPKLQNYGELNPSLIYYYIENLNKRLVEKNANPDSNFTNILKRYIFSSRNLKSMWAKKQADKVENKIKLSVKQREVLNELSRYMFSISKIDTIDYSEFIDMNLLYFYHYLYLTKDLNIEYNSDMDYSNFLNQRSSEKIAVFKNTYVNLKHMDRNKREWWVSEALKYSFLFKESYLDEYPVTTDFYLYEFINRATSPDYNNYNSLEFQLQFDVLPYEFNETLNFQDPFDKRFQYKYTITLQPTMFINTAFKLKTKPELTPFSSLTLCLGYSIYQNHSNTFENTTLWSGIRAISGLYVNGSYIISDYKNFESYSVNALFSTPIYFYSKNLSFSLGLVYIYQHIAFEYDFNVDGEARAAYSETLPEFWQDRTVKIDNDKHLFYPVLSANYYVLPNLSLSCDYLLIKNIRLGLNYHIKL